MSTEILAFLGTTGAALIAMYSAIYTANQGRRAQAITSERAAEIADKESQRAVQIRMLELLGNEVETLNNRIIELRKRLTTAEDFADAERTRRREVEARLEELNDSIERMKNIMGQIPGLDQHPELQRFIQNANLNPTNGASA